MMRRLEACYKVNMPPIERVPAACFADAVAKIADDGALISCNAPMTAWLGADRLCLAALPLDEDQRVELAEGTAVVLHEGAASWELQRHLIEGEAWLTARDVTDRERLEATLLASIRSRSLAEIAASLSHDMNNQLSSALALCAELSVHAQDEEDIQSIRDVEQGTKIGATAFGALARMLVQMPARRRRADVADVLDEAMAVVSKVFQQSGVALQVNVAEALPQVRVVMVDVVHSLVSVLRAVVALTPAEVRVCAEWHPADSSRRAAVVVEVCAHGVDAAQAAAYERLVQFEEGSLHELARSSGVRQALPVAVFLQRRFGGDLVTAVSGDRLTLAFSFPVAR